MKKRYEDKTSILTSIKRLLGIEASYTHFDQDILIHINSVLSTLIQLGIGPKEGFVVKSKTEKWNEFIGDTMLLETVKSYVYLKVRILFDPPTSSFTIDAMERQIKEMEWRIFTQNETKALGGDGVE